MIHWPPHLADRLRAVALGDRVTATGWLETGPGGDSHFEVQSVKNLRTNAAARADELSAPADGFDRSADFAAPANQTNNVERRLKVR